MKVFLSKGQERFDIAGELVFVPLLASTLRNASSEYRVHREVYRKTDFRELDMLTPLVQ